MLIPKNFSNCGGECLCHTCCFGLAINYDRKINVFEYYCRLNSEQVKEVGVCKDYVEAQDEDTN